ncbi:MAG: hypothetical protein V3U98_07390 [Acidobacteriota bacterium]
MRLISGSAWIWIAVAVWQIGCTAARPGLVEQRDAEMTQERLQELILEFGTEVEGEGGNIRFTFVDVCMLCLSDAANNRMRIVTPITDEDNLTDQHRSMLLDANFHTTLDARYATSNGILYAAFIHPLVSLTEDEVLSAIRQVAALARNFGTTFSSGELNFGSSGEE